MIAKVDTAALAGGEKEAQLRRIIERATELEETGDLDGAVNAYEEALLAGFATVEVCYNLALLYKQQLLYEDALTLLQRCLDSPEYGASAHYASGECHLALGSLRAASEHFDRSVSRLALDRIPTEQVGEVSHVLQVTLDTHIALDNIERADALGKIQAEFLSAHGLRVLPVPITTREGATTYVSAELPVVEEPEPVANDRSQTTTGRLRTVYRRATGPLDPNAARQQAPSSALLGRVAPGEGAAGTGTRSLVPTPIFTRMPVAITPTIPLPNESGQPAEIRVLLSRSAEDLTHARYTAVIDDCLQMMVLAPDYLPAHLRLAETYALQGRRTEAAAKCEQLILLYEQVGKSTDLLRAQRLLGAIEPHNLPQLLAMADRYFAQAADPALDFSDAIRALVEEAERQEQDELALEYAEKLLRHQPDSATAIRLAARMHLRSGNPHRALAQCQALLRRDRHDVIAIAGANLALTLIEGTIHWPSLETLTASLRGRDAADRVACLSIYKSTIDNLEPSRRGNAQVAAGLVALACDNPKVAVMHLEALRQAGSTGQSLKPAVRFAMAYALRQAYGALGDGPNERQWLQHAADLLRDERVRSFVDQTRLFGEPISVGALHVGLAESLVRAGKLDNATIVLEAAKADLPDDATIRRRLANLYSEQGRLGQALDELDDLSTHQLNAGRLDAMIETLHQMSALAGENLTVKAHLVDRYLRRGCPDEALAELDRISDIQRRAGRADEAADALRQAADTAWMIGQHERAFALYDRVLALAPDNVTLRQAYINCLLQAGRQPEAATQQRLIARRFWEARRVQETIAALHQVIVLDPRDAESYGLLGEALASVGEYGQAERVYRRLVRLTPDDPVAKAKQAAMAMLVRENRPRP
jgi:tetratricopeptide (TPR) repeat protein